MKKYLVGGFGSLLMTALSFGLVLHVTASRAAAHSSANITRSHVVDVGIAAQ